MHSLHPTKTSSQGGGGGGGVMVGGGWSYWVKKCNKWIRFEKLGIVYI